MNPEGVFVLKETSLIVGARAYWLGKCGVLPRQALEVAKVAC